MVCVDVRTIPRDSVNWWQVGSRFLRPLFLSDSAVEVTAKCITKQSQLWRSNEPKQTAGDLHLLTYCNDLT